MTFIFRSSISTSNNVLGSLKLCMHVGNTHIQGTVSPIYFPYPSFNLCPKTGNFLFIFLNIFSRFYRKPTRIYIKILRRSSLHIIVFNTYVIFQFCKLHNKRDIHVQKISLTLLSATPSEHPVHQMSLVFPLT